MREPPACPAVVLRAQLLLNGSLRTPPTPPCCRQALHGEITVALRKTEDTAVEVKQ
ncbi:hypothetical protein [Thermincola potens]|uniref:hypothetical protein n=1 Tax=Thermincola potens TaxID=863643 RepID=UPI0002E893AB|nr:hypothetical protein [Thermincola potens]